MTDPTNSMQVTWGPMITSRDEWGLADALLRILIAGKVRNPSAERFVGVAPLGFLSYYGFPDKGGATIGVMPSAVVVDGYWTAAAHELGHTYGLWPSRNNGPEEYEKYPQGVPADGYWVAMRRAIANTFCMMTGTGPARSFDLWIDRDDYAALFREMRVQSDDPELLLVTGSIYPDGRVNWYKTLRLEAGIPDNTSGNYTLEFLDTSGNLVSQVDFAASNYINGVDATLEASVFGFATVYPVHATYMQVVSEGAVLSKVNVSGQLLHDAIDGIPDAGFTNNPAERRTALHSRVDAFERAVAAHNSVGARQQLALDLKGSLIRWLHDGYEVRGETEYTKTAILDLVGVIISRLS